MIHLVDFDADRFAFHEWAPQTPEEWHLYPWAESPPYRRFVAQMANWMQIRPYLYQAEPNLRIHPPGGMAVPWHTDEDFGHLRAEWNVWVPLTEITDDSQTIWLDSVAFAGPVKPQIGQALIFPGAKIRHGNWTNITPIVRRSFDFRLLAKKDYRDQGKKTITYGVPLRIGDYWR